MRTQQRWAAAIILSGLILTPLEAKSPLLEYQDKKAPLIASKDAAGLSKLAAWCRKKKLFEEEKEALRLALTADPNHAPAKEELAKILAREQNHKRYETPWRREGNFMTVATNTNEARLHYYCDSFTAYYNRFRKIFGVTANPLDVWKKKIAIHIFGTRKDFDRYQKAHGGELGESAVGYYDFEDKTLVLYEDAENPGETVDTLFHEGTHLLTHLALAEKADNLPMWMLEGLAEYFGPSRYDPETNEIRAGLPAKSRLEELRELQKTGELPTLQELLEVPDGESFESQHYALAWLLTHMLVEKKGIDGNHRYRRKFVSAYEAYAEAAESVPTFEKKVGAIAAIEKELLAYLDEAFPLAPKKSP